MSHCPLVDLFMWHHVHRLGNVKFEGTVTSAICSPVHSEICCCGRNLHGHGRLGPEPSLAPKKRIWLPLGRGRVWPELVFQCPGQIGPKLFFHLWGVFLLLSCCCMQDFWVCSSFLCGYVQVMCAKICWTLFLRQSAPWPHRPKRQDVTGGKTDLVHPWSQFVKPRVFGVSHLDMVITLQDSWRFENRRSRLEWKGDDMVGSCGAPQVSLCI